MDPYVKISFLNRNKNYQTKVHHSGGKTPIWNKKLVVKVNDVKDSVLFTVMDSNMIKDEIIGIFSMTIDKESLSKAKRDLPLMN